MLFLFIDHPSLWPAYHIGKEGFYHSFPSGHTILSVIIA
jgi:hypothetical protein